MSKKPKRFNYQKTQFSKEEHEKIRKKSRSINSAISVYETLNLTSIQMAAIMATFGILVSFYDTNTNPEEKELTAHKDAIVAFETSSKKMPEYITKIDEEKEKQIKGTIIEKQNKASLRNFLFGLCAFFTVAVVATKLKERSLKKNSQVEKIAYNVYKSRFENQKQ